MTHSFDIEEILHQLAKVGFFSPITAVCCLRTDIQNSSSTGPAAEGGIIAHCFERGRFNDLSNEKRAPGCLGYIGDAILPSYVGIMLNH